ncbi:maleate cis-trans isomerase family protein [Thalassovita taeanensis]|uniref:Maleate isomerase n=1 Tax=Thalassovita taeanensis TaxID=657014 RepID=A0A1H9J7Z1_9RHOB|nr:aspartate/glutamate racemase family protein [Thalassovita taeanensis]SEQ83004.1 maleate isomerase [Thalassovita taeanensis]
MKLDFKPDAGIGTRAKLGVIVLQTDETLEPELAQLLPRPGVALYHSRIPMNTEVQPDTLMKMKADLPTAAGLLPASAPFDVIGYGCTSAATVIGPDGVRDAVHSALPDVAVTDPLSALIAACDVLGTHRIGFLTPYVPEVSARMQARLEAAGNQIVTFGSFEESDDRVVARISEASILAAIENLADRGPCDAIIVSCTNLRTAGIVTQAEARIGVPVLSSNLALAWHMLHLAGIPPNAPQFGRLHARTT